MPYIASNQDTSYRIDTGEQKNQRDITIDGKTFTIDWNFIAPLALDTGKKGQAQSGGRYSLLINGKSYEIFARRLPMQDGNGSEVYEIFLAGQRFEVVIEDEREKALAGSAAQKRDSGEASIRAPMPGLVIGVPLEVGAKVTRGQTVIVLEAMKMENDLGSPIAGTLKDVKVSTGQTVNQGDVLAVIHSE
jgi:biotin carboxyl carrier protein